jgi:hypothetical protein
LAKLNTLKIPAILSGKEPWKVLQQSDTVLKYEKELTQHFPLIRNILLKIAMA